MQPKGAEAEGHYHWYDEPDLARLMIEMDFVRETVERAMARWGAVGMRSFLSERGLLSVYIWLKEGSGNVSVGKLRRFCKAFKVDLNDIEKKGIILNPRIFPVDMSSEAFIKLKSHVLNEGKITFRRKSVGRLGYSNQDPVLLRYFVDAVRGVGGDVQGEPRFSRYVLSLHASPVLARALDASGLPFGRKTRTDPPLDPLIGPNTELFRYHIQATLAEEGWCSIIINRHRRARFEVAWGRSVDITDELSRSQIEELGRMVEKRGKRKIPIRRVEDPELLRIISLHPPRLFRQEVASLMHHHERERWPAKLPTKLHLSKEGRITASWEIHIARPDLIDLIHDKYGMLLGTWKARRFEKLYDAYKRYRGRKLTDEEILQIKKVKEENPPEISAEWISEKVREIFPSIKWGGDLDWIRRMLGRKEDK